MDGVFQLIRVVRFLYTFSRGTREFVRESGGAADHHDPERADQLRRWYRRILRVALGVVLGGSVLVPFVAPWLGVWWSGIDMAEAVKRMLLGLLISILPAFLYLFAGVAAGCLTVPADFFRSPAGAKWLELIGTTDLLVARVVCVLVAAVGVGVMVGVAAFLIGMSPAVR